MGTGAGFFPRPKVVALLHAAPQHERGILVALARLGPEEAPLRNARARRAAVAVHPLLVGRALAVAAPLLALRVGVLDGLALGEEERRAQDQRGGRGVHHGRVVVAVPYGRVVAERKGIVVLKEKRRR